MYVLVHVCRYVGIVLVTMDLVAESDAVKRDNLADELRKGLSEFLGGDIALKHVGGMLEQRFKNLETRFYTGGNYPNPPHILRQAAEECDAVIGATGD